MGWCDGGARPWRVFPSMFVVIFAYMMYYLVYPRILLRSVCIELGKAENCDDEEANSKSSLWIMYLAVVGSVLGVLSTAMYGPFSDRFGRRLVLVLPVVGTIIGYIGTLLLMIFQFPIDYLLITEGVSGLFGGVATFYLSHFAYVADCSSVERRSDEVGRLQGLIFLGAALGPVVGGWLSHAFGDLIVVYIAIGISSLAVPCCLIVPESLQPNLRMEKYNWKQANIIGAFGVIFYPSITENRSRMILVMASFFLVHLPLSSAFGVFSLYTNYMMNWSNEIVGYYRTLSTCLKALAAVSTIPTIRFIVRGRLSQDTNVGYNPYIEIWIMRIGAILFCCYHVFLGVFPVTWIFFVVTVLEAPIGACIPCMRSLLSECGTASEQGQIFSAVSVMESLVYTVGPFIFHLAYSLSISSMPALVWFLIALLCAIASLLLFLVTPVAFISRHTSSSLPCENQNLPEHSVA